jgi:hypothetical protein
MTRRYKFLLCFTSYIPFTPPEVPFSGKKGQKGPKSPNLISTEPFVVEAWLTTQNDQKIQVSIVFHIIHTHQTTGSATFGAK